MITPITDKYVLKDTTPWWRFWNRRWTIYSRGYLDEMPLPSSELIYRSSFEGGDAWLNAMQRKNELEDQWLNREILRYGT